MEKVNLEEYLTDPTNIGKLDTNALNELQHNAMASKGVPNLTQMRDAMGWEAKDITRNELVMTDKVIKGNVIVRTYRKKNLLGKALPGLFYLHGGGFFGGSIANVEQISRTFADRGDFEVISIGYRLAPENPFPAGLLDIYNVVEYYATNADKEAILADKLFIAGDSAGGNLAVTAALLDRAYFKTNYLSKVVLYYPAVDMVSTPDAQIYDSNNMYIADDNERQIITEYIYAFAQGGDQSVNAWYGGQQVRTNPLISPAFASDELLATLPAICTIIGEFDPLRLQTDAFMQRLQVLDNHNQYHIYNGMIHAFLDKVGVYPQAELGIMEAINFLEG